MNGVEPGLNHSLTILDHDRGHGGNPPPPQRRSRGFSTIRNPVKPGLRNGYCSDRQRW
jgi:hypothetical protein